MASFKASVLVIDDDVRILRMMKRTLELEGYRVLTASDGEDALDVVLGRFLTNLLQVTNKYIVG